MHPWLMMLSNCKEGSNQPWTKIVWNPVIPPKFTFFFWLAVLERVPTIDRLYFLGVENTRRLCEQKEEDLPHLFFACPFTTDVWNIIKLGWLQRCMTTINSSIKWLVKESRGSSWKCNWRKLCLAATLYYI